MSEISDLTHNGQGQVTVTVNENNELEMPDVNNPPTYLEVTDTYRDRVKVGHRFTDKEAGFDLTSFNTREGFVTLLEELGLDPYYDYARVNPNKVGVNDEYYYYIWGNENGMILLGNNPITGDYSDPAGRQNEPGYASYIGIEGDKEFVDNALVSIVGYTDYYKDIDKQRRSFI
jgi:hypothetical protein